MMDKTVKISLQLLSQTINLLEHWNITNYDPAIQYDYENVYYALVKKRQSLELRQAYAKIIFASDEDARLEARLRYLQQKRENDDF